MSSMFEPQPPELIQAFYGRLSRRYGAPGVCLADFPGRWMVFRTDELAAGLERAIIDIEPAYSHLADGLQELESRASLAVGDGNDATLVVMYLAEMVWVGREGQPPTTSPALAITVWSLAHPVAVAGNIDLDEYGTPIRINVPSAQRRTGSHGAR
jgi:hypothetical protein